MPAGSTRWCRTAAISPASRRIRRFLDSGAIGDGRPASIATSSSPPHFGGFREEMDARAAARHGDPHLRRRPLHGRPATPTASIAANGSRPIPGTGRARRPRRSSSMGGGAVFTYRGSWCADGLQHQLGSAAGASSASAAALIWDGYRRHPGRGGAGGPRGPVRPDASRSRCRRSTRPTAIGGHLGVIEDFIARDRDRHRSRRRAAPTTSRAWRWCSARSRAPRPGAASRSRI